MRESLVRAYHALPPALRSAVVTLRGLQLASWRYGPESDRLRDEALARERWSFEEWTRWREERLAFVLWRAATRVPFYEELWSARRQRGDRSSFERLENWPVLEKESLRRDPAAFVADDRDPRRMFHDHTSGTTGKSLDVWLSRETVREWYALHEARTRAWNGVARGDRWAILGGQLVAPAAQTRPPFWVWNAALRQLYMSAYHIAPATVPHYVAALRDHRVTYVLGYPSALFALAREVLARDIGAPRLRVAILNAEPLLDHQRETIAEAFGCAVRETYGMSEIVAAASECGHGTVHLWPEAGFLEVLDGRDPVPDGATGDLVSTGLLNADMPLIRYRVGDRGARAASNVSCTCGRTLPILAGVEGRSDDVLFTRDGRIVGRLDPVFKSRIPIREAQIVQETLDRVRVRYVPDSGFTSAHGDSVAARIRERMGAIAVVLEPVDMIPRTANGKFRAVVCNLAPEERARASAR
ncbi:MAG: phenylacetate--CoA ligase family protein [Gemmatimonadaceae bacterium]|nr:phenylacetate--CoA ligase family protein [Gemmatimonadaceae bacterium]NUQ91457.1 phenylacetate--CoA ligase family protein [Gemmatimonadaceae bacterium]NUR20295.1 phenylacetate--CoA ligase family protein [Gemmatimonadaceae bacterium]NUS95984.1 phenylacetate--CoA ligase family protein [Gemmatimonadaceae bacterium]